MRYRITHQTTYNYNKKVGLSYNEARLLPRVTDYQHCTAASLVIEPLPADYREHD
ncbi:MAG: hypothetical protein FD130_2329, partial [Halothiobacillaceae bacterium]